MLDFVILFGTGLWIFTAGFKLGHMDAEYKQQQYEARLEEIQRRLALEEYGVRYWCKSTKPTTDGGANE